jgi:hypothetical protein
VSASFGNIRAATSAFLFREALPGVKLPSLWRMLRAGLVSLAAIVLGMVILFAAAYAGAYVDEACVSPTAFNATRSLAERVAPLLPRSYEGGRLLSGGDEFHIGGWSDWPGLGHATVSDSTKWKWNKVFALNWPWMRHRITSWGDTRCWTYVLRGSYEGPTASGGTTSSGVSFPLTFMPPLGFHAVAAMGALAMCCSGAWLARRERRIRSLLLAGSVILLLALLAYPARLGAWLVADVPDYYIPAIALKAMTAAVSAFAICCAAAWLAGRERTLRSLLLAFAVSMPLIVLTTPAAFAAWSGPQLVRMFWEQVFDASGYGLLNARQRAWVNPSLCETAGVLCFGMVYALFVLAAARRATRFLIVERHKGGASDRRTMGLDGAAHCWRCGHRIENLPTCPECGHAHGDAPPWWWPWSICLLRTRRARRVSMCVAVTAVLASAALPLIAGVAEVLLKRL